MADVVNCDLFSFSIKLINNIEYRRERGNQDGNDDRPKNGRNSVTLN